MIQMFTVRNTPQDSFEASMEFSQKQVLVRQARNLIALLPAIYVLTLMWWMPEGDKYVPGLTLSALLLYVMVGGRFKREADVIRAQTPILIGCWAVFAAGSLSYVLNGGSWAELRAFLTVAMFMSVFRGVEVNLNVLKVLLLICLCGFGILSLYQYLSGISRVHGFINPIPYSTGFGGAALFCLAFGLFGRFSSWQRFTLIGVALLTVFPLFMTRTRGVVLPFVVIAVGTLTVYFILHRRGKVSRPLMALMLVVAAVVFSGGLFLGERFQQTISEYNSIAQGDYGGSIGLRLQLWGVADSLVLEKPVLGHGDGYREALAKRYSEGAIDRSLYTLGAGHFHNQFVDALVKKGSVGLIALLVFFVAIWWQLATYPRGSWRRYTGFAVVLLYVTAGLTDVPLSHPATIFLFLGLLFSITAASDSGEKAAPSSTPN